MTALVELDGVERVFAGSPPVHALRPTDLTVRAGDYLTVVGPSGSGKSTLLNVLGLLDEPTAGRYRIEGTDLTGLPERARTAVRGQWIGFVFQAFHLLPYRSATENVALAGLYSGLSETQRRARAREHLVRVGLGHRLDALPVTMSGGERQRVAIARALAHEPRLLLCDEPTGSLDRANGRSVLDLFDELHDAGLTLVVITHDETVAARGNRRLTILDGHLAEPAHDHVG
ncbi:MAG TPA: ABC transporter ATP-binding protein [Friedmanniella sp.]